MFQPLKLTAYSNSPPSITLCSIFVRNSLGRCFFDPADIQASRQFMFARLFSTRKRKSSRYLFCCRFFPASSLLIYKHLLIGPIVLFIFASPRIILLTASLCISTSWHNYLFVTGYFFSFVPFMTTLVIFVAPLPTYRRELQKAFRKIRGRMVLNPIRENLWHFDVHLRSLSEL